MFEQTLQTENTAENVKQSLNRYHRVIFPFYSNTGENFVLRAKGVKLSCKLFVNPEAKAKILIVTGYNESYLKYAEIIYDLFHKGFSVYVYDHRGQGFSDKFPNQRQRGFMTSFDDLVDDLQLYFEYVSQHNKKQKVFILAHSMGGAVTSLAVCKNKIFPERVVLSAPMLGIRFTPYPIFEYPIYVLSKILSFFGFSNMYAFGQRDCFPLITFEKNIVTHSKARYQIWQTHVLQTPEVQLGGPTFLWLRESIKASRELRFLGKTNTVPILLLQAEQDTIVNNAAQDTFIEICQNSTKKVIQHAKHEILLEVDSIRTPTLQLIEDFFDSDTSFAKI